MEKRCKNCAYSVFQLTEKGNVRRSKPGKCEYKIKWPDLPSCLARSFVEPWASAIWSDDGKDCKCFKLKE